MKRFLLLFILLASTAVCIAQCNPNEVIVGISQINPDVTINALTGPNDIDDWWPLHESVQNGTTPLIYLLHSASLTSDQLVAAITGKPGVVSVSKNCQHTTLFSGVTPNDAMYSSQWALPMISAPMAWTLTTGCNSGVSCPIIADLDTGLDYTHPDLAANVWSAPEPFTLTGINGFNIISCPAGTHGVNVCAGTCDPMDNAYASAGHGTRTAGVIGAVGNNSIGTSGLMWNAQILPIRFIDPNVPACNTDSDNVGAIEALIQLKAIFPNIAVANHSYGFGMEDNAGYNSTPESAMSAEKAVWTSLTALPIAEILASGNGVGPGAEAAYLDPSTTPIPTTFDYTHFYVHVWPQSWQMSNMVVVGMSNQNDGMGGPGNLVGAAGNSTNYGPLVALDAPGYSILSTIVGGSWATEGGTSFSSPYTAATVALEAVVCPGLMQSPSTLISELLGSVDADALMTGLTSTGGRLNTYAALQAAQTGCPTGYTLQTVRNGTGSVTPYQGSYPSGASVTLTATPSANSTFTGWSGGGCSGTSPCNVTMSASKTVTATFASTSGGGGANAMWVAIP